MQPALVILDANSDAIFDPADAKTRLHFLKDHEHIFQAFRSLTTLHVRQA